MMTRARDGRAKHSDLWIRVHVCVCVCVCARAYARVCVHARMHMRVLATVYFLPRHTTSKRCWRSTVVMTA